MTKEIPDGITRDDVLQAVSDFNSGVAHPFLESTTYDVIVAGKKYPPKAIVGLAARRQAGRMLSPQDFRGGEGTRCFQVLRKLGFDVVPKEADPSGDFTTLSTEERSREKFMEGATRLVAVNVYERDANARQACIAEHGCQCAVCAFDFSTYYGEIGHGFIHVHHLRDLATIKQEYEVDPVADLRPVCPNCHAMLHMETPAMSIDRLKAMIVAARSPSDSRGTMH